MNCACAREPCTVALGGRTRAVIATTSKYVSLEIYQLLGANDIYVAVCFSCYVTYTNHAFRRSKMAFTYI